MVHDSENVSECLLESHFETPLAKKKCYLSVHLKELLKKYRMEIPIKIRMVRNWVNLSVRSWDFHFAFLLVDQKFDMLVSDSDLRKRLAFQREVLMVLQKLKVSKTLMASVMDQSKKWVCEKCLEPLTVIPKANG